MNERFDQYRKLGEQIMTAKGNMSRVKQSLKQTGESTADKKAKITREERALIREQEKLWKEKNAPSSVQ